MFSCGTEWVETVEAGWNTLVGWDPDHIACAARQAQPEVKAAALYGDGWAAERIVSTLVREGGQYGI